MKSIAKVFLVGAVAVMAIAVSAAPSEAKKKPRVKAGTYAGQVCSIGCGKNNACAVLVWGADKKWYGAPYAMCTKPACPAAC